MRKELEGSMVFDTGTILELIYSTEGGRKLKEALKSERVLGNTSEVNIAELRYVLCRRIGYSYLCLK